MTCGQAVARGSFWVINLGVCSCLAQDGAEERNRIDTGGLRPALTFTSIRGLKTFKRGFSCCVWLKVLWA